MLNRKLIDRPKVCKPSIYETTTLIVAELYRPYSSVVGIYRMGGVGDPGISDLDILVVIDDGESIPVIDFKQHLSTEEQYPLMHSVFVVSKRFWRFRSLFYSYSNLTRLYEREETDVQDIPDSVSARVSLVMAVQHLIRTFADIDSQWNSGSLRARGLLCQLNALKFDVKPLQGFLEAQQLARLESVIEVTKHLRRDWFNLKPQQQLVELERLLKLTKNTIGEVLMAVNHKCAPNHELSPAMSNQVLMISAHRRIHFAGDKLSGTCSWLQHLSFLLNWLPISERLLKGLTSRMEDYLLLLPEGLRSLVIYDETGHGENLRDQLWAERRAILSSPWVKDVILAGYSLPILDFSV